VGVAGAKWMTNEVDKKLLTESIKEVAKKRIPQENCEQLENAPPRQVQRNYTVTQGNCRKKNQKSGE
jgi:hypothetical protein